MAQADRFEAVKPTGLGAIRESVRRAFGEFLALPTAIIAAFLLLAAGSYWIDHHVPTVVDPFNAFLREHFFRDPRATADLLGTVATGLITVVSITFSMLLLAVQQSAASMTNLVFDQFLLRWYNQVFFGFFVGLTLFCLVILATVDAQYNPVFGGATALSLVGVALFLLIVLLYTTINQMRPSVIIEAIHGHTLAAFGRHRDFLGTVRPAATARDWAVRRPVEATSHGYIVGIDAGGLTREVAKVRGVAEVAMFAEIGAFVGFRDEIAEVRAHTPEAADRLVRAVRGAIRLERQRDLAGDPAFGIEQLHTIAWTSISTAKSNPYPGLLAIRSLRDLLVRICDDAGTCKPSAAEAASSVVDGDDISDEILDAAASPVVYADDIPDEILDALESLTIAASESMQHLTLAEIYRGLAAVVPRLPEARRGRVADLVRRSLSPLGDHVLSRELDEAINVLVEALSDAGHPEAGAALMTARGELGRTLGSLQSRSTRAGAGP